MRWRGRVVVVFLCSRKLTFSLLPPKKRFQNKPQAHVKKGKADEAGEALKVKAPKVS
jgi:hypothetical protein